MIGVDPPHAEGVQGASDKPSLLLRHVALGTHHIIELLLGLLACHHKHVADPCYDHVKSGQLRHSDSDIPSRTSPLTYFVNSAGLTSFSYITYHT